ncbi:HD domain-containing protein [Akkermansiaceae bacterium]|nr:HD domain-containing protein [Akkermansiaceae bacterium]MDB4295530.1 HD domain-containing protein [Akkermansiaceae bacterium]MDB4525488.1 HD domain-containing protein [Akkermansiaceae bacterium]MDB4546600.1 HD domain-containing protein [Akkermansiaceae bacterium]
MTISDLLQNTSEAPLEATFSAQLQAIKERETKGGKPYREWAIADATGGITLKLWNNHPQWDASADIDPETFLSFHGEWTKNQYGIDGKGWKFRFLNEDETSDFLAGDPVTRANQDMDWAVILDALADLADPRLKSLCDEFITQFGGRFRRTAAAKKNHHARRGGLVEHVAQMMRSALALHPVYPELNRDLLIAGILFHDCGKLWENTYPESGFNQLQTLHGEMMGHIPLGLELVNKFWRELELDQWKDLEPTSEHVRLHLLHLVASHHGTHEFGSPTLPRTPEAHTLHYIDNLDAKMEMVRDSYKNSNETSPGIYERQFPMPTGMVAPLPSVPRKDAAEAKETPPAVSDELFGS